MSVPDTIIIDYTNWRGERRERRVRPIGIQFGETRHHPERQWLMWALDVEESEPVVKAFALLKIHGMRQMQGSVR